MMLKLLKSIDFSSLQANQVGIEREGLRVDPTGHVATTNHPRTLGEKLTNPFVTVDFSEGLLELITPPFPVNTRCFDFLHNATAYTQQALSNHELIWPASMPPDLCDDDIIIADFGSHPAAQMKKIYRKGLAHRYSKPMQATAGLHYNLSIADDFMVQLASKNASRSPTDTRNAQYFHLMRQFHHKAWLLPYLFGCSPICAQSYSQNLPSYLQPLDDTHYYSPYGTSLRMSRMGYQSHVQQSLAISYTNLSSYVHDLLKATQTEYPAYQTNAPAQDKSQLNSHILQIENEYYNIIRPKQVTKHCERPASALLNRGVQYIEVRCLDVDLFSELGIQQKSAAFLEVFLISCLLSNEEDDSSDFMNDAKENFQQVVSKGRTPNLNLRDNKKARTLKDWGHSILDDCMVIAQQMDHSLNNHDHYQQAVVTEIKKIADSTLTPSARIISHVEDHNGSYHEWVLNKAKHYHDQLMQWQLPPETSHLFDSMVTQSINDWQDMENNNQRTLDEYLDCYFKSPYKKTNS